MKAIITVDVPEHQIGQEVSVYFKDTMCVNGTCESETEVYAKHDTEVIKETVESIWGKPPYNDVLDKIRAEILEEKECAYADFERYKVEYLGQDWEDAYDSLPQDDFRYGMERCIEIIDKYRKGDKE